MQTFEEPGFGPIHALFRFFFCLDAFEVMQNAGDFLRPLFQDKTQLSDDCGRAAVIGPAAHGLVLDAQRLGERCLPVGAENRATGACDEG
jgi:hypothetical protein